MKRTVALAIAAVAQAAIPTLAVAWNGELRPSRHIVVHWRHHSHKAVVHEAVTPRVAPNVTAWGSFVGAFSVPFANPPPLLAWPKIAPYPPGEGDTDGLSTDIDDCNKGCIGVSPN